MSTVTAAFARIEAWLEAQAPALRALLNAGGAYVYRPGELQALLAADEL